MTGAEPLIIAAAVAGTAISAYSYYEQGKSAEQQAKAEAAWHVYNSRIAKRNAEFMRRQLAREEKAGRAEAVFESRRIERQKKMLLARQRALIGASGVEMEGSPLLVAQDTAAELALEGANVLSNIEMKNLRTKEAYQREIYGYKATSILDTYKGRVSKMSGANAARLGKLSAGASILQGTLQAGYMGHRMYGGRTAPPTRSTGGGTSYSTLKSAANFANQWLSGS